MGQGGRKGEFPRGKGGREGGLPMGKVEFVGMVLLLPDDDGQWSKLSLLNEAQQEAMSRRF